jgi:hypothetical protein
MVLAKQFTWTARGEQKLCNYFLYRVASEQTEFRISLQPSGSESFCFRLLATNEDIK